MNANEKKAYIKVVCKNGMSIFLCKFFFKRLEKCLLPVFKRIPGEIWWKRDKIKSKSIMLYCIYFYTKSIISKENFMASHNNKYKLIHWQQLLTRDWRFIEIKVGIRIVFLIDMKKNLNYYWEWWNITSQVPIKRKETFLCAAGQRVRLTRPYI